MGEIQYNSNQVSPLGVGGNNESFLNLQINTNFSLSPPAGDLGGFNLIIYDTFCI
jgi:hypothetical protein